LISENDIVKLNTLFKYLLDELPFGNWRLNLFFIRADEMMSITESPTTFGATKIKNNMEFANIYLNIDAIYEEWDIPEETLIHEMVHVLHNNVNSYIKTTYETNDYYINITEQFINHMSAGIYNLLEHNI